MANYYCLMAGVPDISLEDIDNAKITLEQFRNQTEEVITEQDSKLLYYFYLKQDCLNLVAMLRNPDFQIQRSGNLSHEQLEDLITSARTMNFNVHRYPAFMSIFAREFDYNKNKQHFFPEDTILYEFYQYALDCPNKFIQEWYKLNLDLTNMLTAFIARKQGWNVADFIYGDNEVNEMIRNNSTKDFDLKNEFDYVSEIMKIVDCEDPVQKEKLIDVFKWNWLDEATFFDVFSIEAVFAYLCKLDMLDRWEKLEPEKGKEEFRNIIETLRGEAKVPEEFVKKTSALRHI
mgnify:CR=1 FL=1